MEYYLMFHLDKSGNNGIVLCKNNDLVAMDDYIINNFTNRNDVFNKYRNDIEEFCLDNRKIIMEENIRNNRDRTGAITLFCKYTNNYGVHTLKIPIIYGNDNRLLNENTCLKKIKEKLSDDKVLKELISSKSYLLSYNEMNLISLYFKFNNPKVKEEFGKTFLNRIKGFQADKKYFFFRCLMNLCSLNETNLNLKKGKVSNIKTNMPLKTKVEKENDFHEIKMDDKVDEYLISLIEQDNYEELNKYYDIETIEKYRNLYKNKR